MTDGPLAPQLSVVVPAYMEGHRIGASVLALRAALGDDAEIIVVDDGSPDATGSAAKEAGAEVIRLPVNKGKGAAVRAGVLAARGATVVFTDADLSYAPPQILRLTDALSAGADVVVGSRRHVGTTTLVRAGMVREISGRVFNLCTRLVLPRAFGDTQCGLKGFRRGAAHAIFERTTVDGFAFDVEVLWLASHLGYTVVEVPVELDSAPGSTVRLSREVARMVRDLVRIRRRASLGGYR